MTENPQQREIRFAHLALASLLWVSLAAAQQAPGDRDRDPPGPQLLARVVHHESGAPQPGVLLHITQRGMDAPRLDANGLLIVEDVAIRRLRAASTVRTNTNGTAMLRMAPSRGRIRVGPPFYQTAAPKRIGDVWQIQVGKLRQVNVRAVGADGRAVAGLAVALHAAGKDLSIALTDKSGHAKLGIPDGFTARAAIAPAGWVGPKHHFPSVAGSLADPLAGRTEITLQVPQHGSVHLRRMRNGLPERGPVAGLEFFAPQTYARLSTRPHVGAIAKGLAFPMVALDADLTCYPPFQAAGMLELRGPREAGKAQVVDVEVGRVTASTVLPDPAESVFHRPALPQTNCTDLDGKSLVRIVDQHNVPIAGARINAPSFSRSTDGRGEVVLDAGQRGSSATISAPGMRSKRCSQWPPELVVTLEPEDWIHVRVVGLPKDLPRTGIQVWLRDEVRERFAGPRDQLGDDDRIALPLPPRGRYVPSLWLASSGGSKSMSMIYMHGEAITIDEPTEGAIELRLDAKTVERLRKKIGR